MDIESEETELIIIKLLFIAFIFFLTLIFGLIPYHVKTCSENQTILSIAKAFSGGIFLAIALLHIIPEAHTQYLVYLHKAAAYNDHDTHTTTAKEEPHGVILGGVYRNLHGIDNVHEFLELGFPLPYFAVFVGYTFILMIDKVIFDSHAIEHKNDHFRDSIRLSTVNKRQRSNSNANQDANGIQFVSNFASGGRPLETFQKYNEFKDEDEIEGNQNDDIDISEGIRQYLSKADRFSARIGEALSKKYTKGERSREIDIVNRMRSNTGDPSNSEKFQSDRKMFENSIVQSKPAATPNDFFSAILLMVALSTHSVFEGIAVGLQGEISDVWNFFVAIGLHKWAEAMCLGISMSCNLEHNKNLVKILI